MKQRDYRQMERFEVELIQVLDDIAAGIFENAEETRRLVKEVRNLNPKPKLSQARITVMPKTIAVGGTSKAVIAALGSDGQPFALTSANVITPVASNMQDVTFGATSFPGDGTVVFTVTGVNVDSGDSISATVDAITTSSDTLTITAAVPTLASATLTLN